MRKKIKVFIHKEDKALAKKKDDVDIVIDEKGKQVKDPNRLYHLLAKIVIVAAIIFFVINEEYGMV